MRYIILGFQEHGTRISLSLTETDGPEGPGNPSSPAEKAHAQALAGALRRLLTDTGAQLVLHEEPEKMQ